MRKTAFCKGKNQGADQLRGEDQLRGDRADDQRLCFRYIDSKTPLLSKSEIQATSQ